MSNFQLTKINKRAGSIIDGSYQYFIEIELNKILKNFNENNFDCIKNILPIDLSDMLKSLGDEKFQLICNSQTYEIFNNNADFFEYAKILKLHDLSADKIKKFLINCAIQYIKEKPQINNDYKLFVEEQFTEYISYSYVIILCKGNFNEQPELIFANKLDNLFNLDNLILNEFTDFSLIQSENGTFLLKNGASITYLAEYRPDAIYTELKYGSIDLYLWLIDSDDIKLIWKNNDEINYLYSAAIDKGSLSDLKLIFSYIPIEKYSHLINYLIQCQNENKFDFILYLLNRESIGLKDLLIQLNIENVAPLLSLINNKDQFISTLRGANLKKYINIKLKNKNFLLLKENLKWIIASAEDFDSINNPKYIGEICNYGLGELPNTTKLAWKIDPDYQGNGYMKELLSQYINAIQPNESGFEVIILNDNLPSIKLALAVGFIKSKERDRFSQFLLKK